ncbi:MAG: hypothetical protein ACP5OO_12250 [Chloroflexia bacterium]
MVGDSVGGPSPLKDRTRPRFPRAGGAPETPAESPPETPTGVDISGPRPFQVGLAVLFSLAVLAGLAIFLASAYTRQTAIPTPTATATATPSPPPPTFTPRPTATPRPTFTPTPAPTPLPDLSVAVLSLQDLPGGFEILPPEGRPPLLITATAFLSGTVSSSGRLYNLTGFRYPGTRTPEIVLFYLLFPLSPEEQKRLDARLADPPSALGMALESLGGVRVTALEILPKMDNLGEASAGVAARGTVEGAAWRLEVAMVRQGAAFEYILVAYPEEKKPPLSLRQAAEPLDERVKAALGGR